MKCGRPFMKNNNVLELRGISKSFSGIPVLQNVRFDLKPGEIHALVGENGAGKSTLMNIIDGVHLPNEGEIIIDGKVAQIKNPHDAQKLGIAFVHQEIALCPDVTVAENIFMASINNSKRLFMNYNQLFKEAKEVLKELADIPPDAIAGAISLSKQQIVEIAKALTMNCKVLILDEPTASLSESETKALFTIMQKLKEQGISIIYISHRMAEIFSQCDRVTILRDGQYMGTYGIEDINEETVVNKMVGREITSIYPSKGEPIEDTLFEVQDISDGNRCYKISFKLKQGEILGISGLVGAGRSELAQTICGLRKKSSGKVLLKGEEVQIKKYGDAIANKIVYLTEDRKQEGLFLEMSIKENISAMKVEGISRGGFINRIMEQSQSENYIDHMAVKCQGMDQDVLTLSGGNQQKVLISKLLTIDPKIIFMDEPTRGIDVGAKTEIHKLLRNLCNQGIGIVLISSELPEIIGMCDRVIVMHEGQLTGELEGDITEEKIMYYASGFTKEQVI